MARDFFSSEYSFWIGNIETKLTEEKWDWDKIMMWGKDSDEELQKYFDELKKMGLGIHIFSVPEWKEFVKAKKDYEENSRPIEDLTYSATKGMDDLEIPCQKDSAWMRYKEQLSGKFPGIAVQNIERSSKKILNMLEDGEQDGSKAVHGLVMGNVQSGKTANMEGLMCMAADYGWNMFIVLSGTIDNLRQQTRERFMGDLKSGNLTWNFSYENPTPKKFPPEYLELEKNNRNRYVIVCLKNAARLSNLLKWINKDLNKKRQMKVVLIDDESDQASVNTSNIEEEREATRINKLIKALVNGNVRENSEEIVPYKAMNYIAYSATPYGNFLNEKGEGTLYPSDFIHVLPVSDTYFGPVQIFGDIINGTTDGLPIINTITTETVTEENIISDVEILETINDECKVSVKNITTEIPGSLKKAIAWFCICVAIQRYRGSKKPVSMLVHHSMKVEYHTSISYAIRKWYDNIDHDEFIKLCREVYTEQTSKMTLKDFIRSYATYGQNSGIDKNVDIYDYPEFSDIRRNLDELKDNPLSHITMDKDKGENYVKGLHLCVDNCSYVPIIDDFDEDKIPHIRLVYPRENLDFAPEFLVVGGNTMARGLTLEGLVCTYFSRVVKQADTLMQMGRWFGYRRGYELLPRLWMTESAVERFEQLAALDEQLRGDIWEKYISGDVSPDQYGPLISNCPLLVGMKITANNKQQSAEDAVMDFAGAHIQTISFVNDDDLLSNNLDVAEKFLQSLGEDNKSLNAENETSYRVWENVPFKEIQERLLEKSSYELTGIGDASVFSEWFSKKSNDYSNWSVILRGKKSSDSTWMGVGKVIRTRLLTGCRKKESNKLTIGTLGDPGVWDNDIELKYRTGDSEEERQILSLKKPTTAQKIVLNKVKKTIRERAGKKDTPRLILYCIDHESDVNKKMHSESAANEISGDKRERAPLRTNIDVMGIEIFIPGSRGDNKNYATAVRIRQ